MTSHSSNAWIWKCAKLTKETETWLALGRHASLPVHRGSPEEDLFHGGDGRAEAAYAQLRLPVLQISKQSLKTGMRTEMGIRVGQGERSGIRFSYLHFFILYLF